MLAAIDAAGCVNGRLRGKAERNVRKNMKTPVLRHLRRGTGVMLRFGGSLSLIRFRYNEIYKKECVIISL